MVAAVRDAAERCEAMARHSECSDHLFLWTLCEGLLGVSGNGSSSRFPSVVDPSERESLRFNMTSRSRASTLLWSRQSHTCHICQRLLGGWLIDECCHEDTKGLDSSRFILALVIRVTSRVNHRTTLDCRRSVTGLVLRSSACHLEIGAILNALIERGSSSTLDARRRRVQDIPDLPHLGPSETCAGHGFHGTSGLLITFVLTYGYQSHISQKPFWTTGHISILPSPGMPPKT